MPEEDISILKYNQEVKSLKALIIAYADTEPLLEKTDTCLVGLAASLLVNILAEKNSQEQVKK